VRALADKTNSIQGRYWINRALAAGAGEFSTRNLTRMRLGLAPQRKVLLQHRKTGKLKTRWESIELHHNRGGRGIPGRDSPFDLREVTPSQHEGIDQFRHTGYDVLNVLEGL